MVSLAGTSKLTNMTTKTKSSAISSSQPSFVDELKEEPRTQLAMVEVVIPVYNEQIAIGPCVYRLHEYLEDNLPNPHRITIADNASTDDTLAIAHDIARRIPEVQVKHLDRKGRGNALHDTWGDSDADVLVYMDVDLSTDLMALQPLVAPILSGHSDIAIGTRLARGSRVVRGPKREFISRSYNLLLRFSLGTRFSDAQCGFKAISARAAKELLPLVVDPGWFFDTELLVLAERSGLRIHEVPVDWVDDPDSSVDIASTAWEDIKGVARLAKGFASGAIPVDQVRQALDPEGVSRPVTPQVGLLAQLLRFGAIGVVSTVAFVLLFVVFTSFMGSQAANVSALLITAVCNVAANRRITFGISGRRSRASHYGQGLIVFLVAWALTAGSLAIYQIAGIENTTLEILVLIVANLMATLFRFVVLKNWVFRSSIKSS